MASQVEAIPERRSLPAEAMRIGIVVALGASAALGIALGLLSGIGLLWFIPYTLVGSVLIARSKGGLIGPLLLAIGWAHVVLATPVPATPAQIGLGSAPPGVLALAILSGGPLGPALFLLYFLLMTVFPTGKLPDGRWGAVVRTAVTAIGVLVVGTTFGATITINWSGDAIGVPIRNPIAIAPGSPISQALASGIAFLPAAVLMVAGAVSLVVRHRRVRGLEQQQLRWIVAALAWIVTAVVGGFVVGLLVPEIGSGGARLQWLPAGLSFPLVPGAIGVAVLRYRLYEIDIVIRRTLVYVPLTAILAGAYAATTSFLQRFFVTVTGNRSDSAVIMSTLVLVALFTPVKNALQAWVDRRFRDPRDLARELLAFTDEVNESLVRPDPARVMARFLAVAAKAANALGGTAEIAGPAGSWTEVSRVGDGTGVIVIDVRDSDAPLGRIALSARRGGRPYSTDEETTLQAAAGRLAAAFGGPL